MLKRIKLYLGITNIKDIARRYFVLNGFDGLYTMLGIIVGSYVAGHHEAGIVLGTGLAGVIALGISGSATAYFTEKAIRERELNKLEKSMLTDLDGTIQDDARSFATIFAALVNGFSPIFMAMMMVIPFLISKFNMIAVENAFIYSLMIGIIEISLVGYYLGEISDKKKRLGYSIRMVGIALIAATASYLIGIIFT
jgi:predicted membrane protein (TIGR00267 family)